MYMVRRSYLYTHSIRYHTLSVQIWMPHPVYDCSLNCTECSYLMDWKFSFIVSIQNQMNLKNSIEFSHSILMTWKQVFHCNSKSKIEPLFLFNKPPQKHMCQIWHGWSRSVNLQILWWWKIILKVQIQYTVKHLTETSASIVNFFSCEIYITTGSACYT